MDIRIGNDIPMLWRFLTRQADQKVDYDMTGRDLSLRLTDSQGHAMDMPFTVSGNALFFTFFGKDQRRIGNYMLTLIENAGQQGMRTIDKIKPFNLVPVQEVVMGGQIAGSVSELEVQPLVLESEFCISGSGGTDDFDSLSNRPKYNGAVMTHQTNVLGLPVPTEFDEGKIPKIQNGAWVLAPDLKLSITEIDNPDGGSTLTIGG